MAYNVSLNAINKVEDYLETLIAADCTLSWDSKEPAKLAYALREAVHAAQVKNVERYKNLAHKFSFRVRGNTVIAKYRLLTPNKEDEVLENVVVKTFPAVSLGEIVIELSKQENKNVTEFRFPYFSFTLENELDKFVKYCTNMNLEYSFPSGLGVIIERK